MKNPLALTDQGQGISKVNGVCRVAPWGGLPDKTGATSAGQVSNESLILAQNQRWRRA